MLKTWDLRSDGRPCSWLSTPVLCWSTCGCINVHGFSTEKHLQLSAQPHSKFKSTYVNVCAYAILLASPPLVTPFTMPNDCLRRSSFIAFPTLRCRSETYSRTAFTTGDSQLMSLIMSTTHSSLPHAWLKSTQLSLGSSSVNLATFPFTST